MTAPVHPAPRRPRFVVGLCAAAALAIAAELAAITIVRAGSASVPLLGMRMYGAAAVAVLLAHASVQAAVAVGLWRLRRWARVAAMVYLAFLLASFLLWGLGGGGAVHVLAFQLSGVPFLTFSFMYLYRGARYFTPGGDRPSRTPV